MGYIVCNKGKTTKLSASFTSREFDCHGSGCCMTTTINSTLVEYLQKIRDHFKKPITITSGYRCPTHNRNVGGATGSRHSKGDAADIVVKGVAPREVAKYAESIGIMGIGLYETSKDGYFTHIDTRSAKSFWYGQSEKRMDTFGGSASKNTVASDTDGVTIATPVESKPALDILNRGDRGESVKSLQEKLIKLGYSCGALGADGDFGTATDKAVRKLQKDYGLVQDGIVGNDTYTVIEKAIVSKKIIVQAIVLNVRTGAGTKYPIISTARKNEIYDVSDQSNGWARITDPIGWVSLQYCKKVI